VDAQIKAPLKERITTRIYEDFIVPFRDMRRNDRSAMILHGPPGTAKTTLAEAIATELKWDLITITPSDFVKEGLENSEKSARLLFKHLMQLRDAVVLFDEIDELLRDRQDDQSQGGVAMLRFIVPGMLPKLQLLKQYGERNRLIFIVPRITWIASMPPSRALAASTSATRSCHLMNKPAIASSRIF
jgi:SpoVK/Ycf46/Vps4 family AAA+-type ATPase